MKNEYVLSAQEQVVSQIEETNKIVELFRAISANVPKSGNAKKIIDMGEFREAWGKCLEERNIKVQILDGKVDDCHDVDNHELEEAR